MKVIRILVCVLIIGFAFTAEVWSQDIVVEKTEAKSQSGPVYNFNFNNGEVNAPIQQNSGVPAKSEKPSVSKDAEGLAPSASKSKKNLKELFSETYQKSRTSLHLSISQGESITLDSRFGQFFVGGDNLYEVGMKIDLAKGYFLTPSITRQNLFFRGLGSVVRDEVVYGGKLLLGVNTSLFGFDWINALGYQYQETELNKSARDIVGFNIMKSHTVSINSGPSIPITDDLSFSLLGKVESSVISIKDDKFEYVDKEISEINYGGSGNITYRF